MPGWEKLHKDLLKVLVQSMSAGATKQGDLIWKTIYKPCLPGNVARMEHWWAGDTTGLILITWHQLMPLATPG